jgi:hypothetical protein
VDIGKVLPQAAVNDLLKIGFCWEDAMIKNSLKALPLMLCALLALPAAAGERHSQRGGGSFHLGNVKPWYGNRDRHHGRDRYVRLRQFSPSYNGYSIRSNDAAAYQNDGQYFNGTYAGSYSYDVDGGTYIGTSGYSIYGAPNVEHAAPRAKIIDVAIQDDPCEYQANVCVIRP